MFSVFCLMLQRVWESLSLLEIVSLAINIILIVTFFVLFKLGKFSKEFVEARTIENSKIHYRIETYKTKMNNWVYKVIDMDNDKKVYTSGVFQSKLNLDREVLRKYENLDEVIGNQMVKPLDDILS